MLYGIDIYHGDVLVSDVHKSNEVECFEQIKNAGCAFVIHKATQGIGVNDGLYAKRRKSATAAGLLWGAYHFNTGDKSSAQVQHFLDAVQPDKDTYMALDFEDNKVSEMNLAGAVEFLTLLDAELTKISGEPRFAKIYGGNRIKSQIVNADASTRAFLAKHGLWGCEYGPKFKMVDADNRPLPWSAYEIWQFTGDGIGPTPHIWPGIYTKGIDINRFEGDINALKAIWA